MNSLALFLLSIFLLLSVSCSVNEDTNDWIKRVGKFERFQVTISNVPPDAAEKIDDIYRVDKNGSIKLPFLPRMRVLGRDQFQIAKQISSAYQAAGLSDNPQVNVRIMKNRKLY